MSVVLVTVPLIPTPAQGSRLTVCNLLDRTVLINVDIQSFRLVIHRAHAVGLQDAMLLGKINLGERLVLGISFTFCYYGGRVCLYDWVPKVCRASGRIVTE